jgi:hypothetical protein
MAVEPAKLSLFAEQCVQAAEPVVFLYLPAPHSEQRGTEHNAAVTSSPDPRSTHWRKQLCLAYHTAREPTWGEPQTALRGMFAT